MELQVRDAKITDVERVTTLIEHAQPELTLDELDTAAELLRRMVYLPNASVTVALDGRQIVAGAMLSLRPSVAAGGPVASVDFFLIEPGWEQSEAPVRLLAELVRSARNKGCALIEARTPRDAAELENWQTSGFASVGPRLARVLEPAPVAAG